jgi:hypothetical protein
MALRAVIFIRNILQYGVELTEPSRKENCAMTCTYIFFLLYVQVTVHRDKLRIK